MSRAVRFPIGRGAAFVALLFLVSCGEAVEAEDLARDATPVQAEPYAWGEAKHGLRLSLSFVETRLQKQSSVIVTVRAQNTGAAPLHLMSLEEETWCYLVSFEGLDGASDFQGGAGFFIEYEEPQNGRLAPGAIWQKTVDISEEERRFLRVNPDRKPGDDWDYRDTLPPGRYRAYVEYANESGSSEEFWVGRVKSNSVDITVEG